MSQWALAERQAGGTERESATSPDHAPAEHLPVYPGGHSSIMRLQQEAGNAAVAGLLGESGTPLDRSVREPMEARLGADFGDVRVHTGDSAASSARAFEAEAYTVGQHVVFDAGAYQPGTPEGLHTIAHELTHVVQQRSGPVEASQIIDGVAVSDPSDRFERAADEAAEGVLTDIGFAGATGTSATAAAGGAPAPST